MSVDVMMTSVAGKVGEAHGCCPANAQVAASPDAFPQLRPTVYRPASTHGSAAASFADCC